MRSMGVLVLFILASCSSGSDGSDRATCDEHMHQVTCWSGQSCQCVTERHDCQENVLDVISQCYAAYDACGGAPGNGAPACTADQLCVIAGGFNCF